MEKQRPDFPGISTTRVTVTEKRSSSLRLDPLLFFGHGQVADKEALMTPVSSYGKISHEFVMME